MPFGRCLALALALCAVSRPDPAAAQGAPPPDSAQLGAPKVLEGGPLEPGTGFPIVTTDYGELRISAYALFRYLNQLPADASYVDHLGRPRDIDTRQDLQWHRGIVYLIGWIYDPRFTYAAILWTVNATEQVAIIGTFRWRFNDALNVGVGINGMPGTRTLRGSHPYWLGHDRVMSDEFFRPGFTSAAWIEGVPVTGLSYHVALGTNHSQLGIGAGEDSRSLATAGTIAWMPTTGEFGPRAGFGDYEHHQELATRVGVSAIHSHEDRYSNIDASPEATMIRLQDAVNVFDPGALAEGVTVRRVRYVVASADAGLKYKGFFLTGEYSSRWLTDFDADGPIPVSEIHDRGFYVQSSYHIESIRLEPYLSTSWVFGDEDAGFDASDERIVGLNWFPLGTRNMRVNVQLIDVNDSPVSRTFGYYMGGLDGQIVSAEVSTLF
jgi:hypothetical protein